jgi:hypothetical protein
MPFSGSFSSEISLPDRFLSGMRERRVAANRIDITKDKKRL